MNEPVKRWIRMDEFTLNRMTVDEIVEWAHRFVRDADEERAQLAAEKEEREVQHRKRMEEREALWQGRECWCHYLVAAPRHDCPVHGETSWGGLGVPR